MEGLIINPKFAEQIPPLSELEFAQLEENILADGRVLNPIIVWKQPEAEIKVIVDGHNRYRIVQLHPEIPYEIFEKQFPDEYAVLAFIYKTQLGRRNLTPQQRKYLIGKQYNAEKMSIPFRGNQYTLVNESGSAQNEQNQNNGWICERIASENNTNSAYVRRAAKYADGIDMAEETDPGIKNEILSGAINSTDKAITEVAKATPEKRNELVHQLRNPPEKKPVKRSLPKADADESDEIFGEEETAEPVTKVTHKQIMEIYDGLVHGDKRGIIADCVDELQPFIDEVIPKAGDDEELNTENIDVVIRVEDFFE